MMPTSLMDSSQSSDPHLSSSSNQEEGADTTRDNSNSPCNRNNNNNQRLPLSNRSKLRQPEAADAVDCVLTCVLS